MNYIKLYPKAPDLKKAHSLDAGWDLTAIAVFEKGARMATQSTPPDNVINSRRWTTHRIGGHTLEVHTGIGLEIPRGYVGIVAPRSSICNYDLILTNSFGVIDPGFQGAIKLNFLITKEDGKFYKVGDRVGQLLIVKLADLPMEEAEGFSSESDRGSGGFGSSGT